MSAALNAPAPEPTPPTPPSADAPTDAETEFQRQTLHDLTVWSADVAYRLRNAVELADDTADLLALAAAFDHAARGVRRCVMLARHVARPPRPEPPPPALQTRPSRPTLRLADRETPDRLDTPDPAPDGRPIDEQIAAIRRDLEPLAAAYTATATPAEPRPTPDITQSRPLTPLSPPRAQAQPPPAPDG